MEPLHLIFFNVETNSDFFFDKELKKNIVQASISSPETRPLVIVDLTVVGTRESLGHNLNAI